MNVPAKRVGGFTLVELIVAMAVMGVTLAVSSLAISRNVGRAAGAPLDSTHQRARRSSIEKVAPVVAWPDSANVYEPVLYLPDGRVIGRAPDSNSRESVR